MEGGFNLPLILIRIICNHPHNPMNHFSTSLLQIRTAVVDFPLV